MIHPQALIKLFGYNAELVTKQLRDMSHVESLWSASPAVNSINWVLGHIVSARTIPLQLVDGTRLWSDTQRARYRHGSANITRDEPGVLRLDELLAAFTASQERLVAGLHAITYTAMCQPSGYRDNTIGDSLAYFQFHEAHHVGQIVYLAQLAGRPGVWLS